MCYNDIVTIHIFYLFIASFAFVLQMLRAKPIPLKMHERVQRLPCAKGAVALATEGLFPAILGFFTIPPSAFGCHLPLHKGGFSLVPLYHKSAEKTSSLPKFCAAYFSAKNADRNSAAFLLFTLCAQALLVVLKHIEPVVATLLFKKLSVRALFNDPSVT